MPTISQLPVAAEVTAADEIPISQVGVTHSASIGTLLASTQPAIISDQGTLLGRISLGAGGPETVTVGAGLQLNGGTLAASAFNPSGLPQRTTLSMSDNAMLNSNGMLAQLPLSSLRGLFSAGTNISIDGTGIISSTVTTGGTSNTYSITSLVPVTSIASSDLVGISQGGTDHTITYTNLLDGLTIDLAQPAVPASDTDTLWVAQGSSTMLRQTFAAIWSWLTSKQPTYKLPVVEIIANTNLDGTIHNGRILICSQPVTLTPAPPNMGSGFYCDIVNLSTGNVTLGSGIITSSGSTSLPSGQAATCASPHTPAAQSSSPRLPRAAPVAAPRWQYLVRSPASASAIQRRAASRSTGRRRVPGAPSAATPSSIASREPRPGLPSRPASLPQMRR